MTHTKMADEAKGDLSKPEPCQRTCPSCGDAAEVTVQAWNPHDGGLPDDKYTCGHCNHVWWIDGGDS